MMEAKSGLGRIWWIVGIGLMAAWSLYLVVFGPKAGRGDLLPPPLEKSGLTAPADYAWSLLDLNDKPVDFARYRGKAVFLNLWSTSCPPCLDELPAIANLASDPRLKEVAFVCVSTDDSAATVRSFLRDKTWDMTMLRATSLPEVYNADGLPATFLISPDGQVAVSVVGAAQWDDPSVVAYLERLARPAPVKAHAPL